MIKYLSVTVLFNKTRSNGLMQNMINLSKEQFLAVRVYDLYTDYVLKNPFYEMEMPVRCELFDVNLGHAIGSMHRRWGTATS